MKKILPIFIVLTMLISGCFNNTDQETIFLTGYITTVDLNEKLIVVDNSESIYVSDITDYHIGQKIKAKIKKKGNKDSWDPKLLEVIEISIVQ
ncbi:hypothetical protein [Paenibacillus arenosi]|uniref:DUF3221 domain-containing protein n=1 Tax=Paenibacillus arenosi TaxID=2774142 RepID=A0ABR9B253_9BACL|nr:hypothetical protein [Paenibacillus arenosi]MBD8499266.1 hypothetical protein [Paenibacillus arenosi]